LDELLKFDVFTTLTKMFVRIENVNNYYPIMVKHAIIFSMIKDHHTNNKRNF